jgi:hypothetical protein
MSHLFHRGTRCALALQVVLASSLLFASPHRLAAAGGVDNALSLCTLQSLPEDIRGGLTRHFSEWKILEPTDLSSSARERWAAEKPAACPGMAAGHFQNGKDTAYALLLIPTDRSDPEFALVVFTPVSNKGLYAYKVVDRLEAGGSDSFMLSAPISKYIQDESILKSRSGPGDSLLVVTAGATTAAYVYYWANDSYRRQKANY